jgi:hypothetical protein
MASQEEDGGLLSGLGKVFSRQPSQEPIHSPASSNGSSADPLSEESARLLASVPDSIGSTEPGDDPELPGDDAVASLMAMVAFEPQDVQDTLCEFFDWTAERFKSDHWRLTDRQARMLGKPSALLLNSLWARLCVIMPDIIGRWASETPGASAFLLAVGIVVIPKVTKQIQVSRQRKSVKPVIQPNLRPESVRPQPPPPDPTVGDATGPNLVQRRQ